MGLQCDLAFQPMFWGSRPAWARYVATACRQAGEVLGLILMPAIYTFFFIAPTGHSDLKPCVLLHVHAVGALEKGIGGDEWCVAAAVDTSQI